MLLFAHFSNLWTNIQIQAHSLTYMTALNVLCSQNSIHNTKTLKYSSLWAVKCKEYSLIHVCNQFYGLNIWSAKHSYSFLETLVCLRDGEIILRFLYYNNTNWKENYNAPDGSVVWPLRADMPKTQARLSQLLSSSSCSVVWNLAWVTSCQVIHWKPRRATSEDGSLDTFQTGF